MMYRFYCPDLPPRRETGPLSDTPDTPDTPAAPLLARLDAQEAHHARRVLRVESGETVEVFDGRGTVGRGVFESGQQGTVIRLTELRHTPAAKPAIDIAAAIPKGPHADDMVSQLSQLGIDRLIPLQTERTVVDPRPGKIEKFTRAAIESAKQCGRAYVMSIEPPARLARVLGEPCDLRLIAMPGGGAPDDLAAKIKAADRVLILIGPEGGWTPEELDAARAAGCVAWSLGPHILRIETAAAAGAAVARYLAGR